MRSSDSSLLGNYLLKTVENSSSIVWSPEAKTRVEKAPFFIRRFIKKKAESYAREQGLSLITESIIDKLKPSGEEKGEINQKIQNEVEETIKKNKGDLRTAGGVLSVENLDLIKSLMQTGIYVGDPDKNESFEIKLCGGARGCPLTLTDIESLGQKIHDLVKKSAWPKFFEKHASGPILYHSKLKIAIAGCPNACSEPQIRDVGLIAQEKPLLQPELCDVCSVCFNTCKEDAIRIVDDIGPIFNDNCISCGQCIMACPSEVLIQDKKG